MVTCKIHLYYREIFTQKNKNYKGIFFISFNRKINEDTYPKTDLNEVSTERLEPISRCGFPARYENQSLRKYLISGVFIRLRILVTINLTLPWQEKFAV